MKDKLAARLSCNRPGAAAPPTSWPFGPEFPQKPWKPHAAARLSPVCACSDPGQLQAWGPGRGAQGAHFARPLQVRIYVCRG